ncbi:MAG: threonine synthase [Chloroflexota bacterium]
MNIKHLMCLICGKEYQPDEVAYVCPDHGNEGILDVVYDYGRIAQSFSKENLSKNPDPTIWRYKPLLPVGMATAVPPLAVGGTPLYDAERLAKRVGVKKLWVKDDGRNPTASFKDRASAVAVVKAQEAKADVVTTASTGNAAAALSGICASVGQKNVIFVPKSAPEAKIAQLLTLGSTVMLVDGSYDDAFELCLEAADAYGWYNRNTGFNPYMTEGKKTVSFEIAEQLNWQLPDFLFVSVGDGCIIGGVHKGFKDLLALGWIDQIPKLVGVQADGSNFLAEAWSNGEDVLYKAPISANTVADSISAGLPRDRLKALAAVNNTDGAYITVTDDEILNAIPRLAQGCGVFAEPAGAAAYAGLLKAVEMKMIGADDTVVVVNTGNGLKDIQAAMKGVESVDIRPFLIQPKLEEVRKVVGG